MTTFRTEDGCDFALTRTPEGDLLVQMKVEHGSKEGLVTATVSSAPENRVEILGTYASVKLDAASRQALSAALADFDAPEPYSHMRGFDEPDDEHTEEQAHLEAFLEETDVYAHAHEPEVVARLALEYGLRRATDEYDRILTRQSDLLRGSVNALRGAPPELVWWSVHDIPQLAQAAVLSIARILAKPLEWSNVKPENQEYYLAQARQMVVEEADRG